MTTTPVSLLERLRDRADHAAWERWVSLYQPVIRRWLGQRRLPPQDADDLTQEVLVVVLTELPRFEHNGRVGAFRTWLRQVLANRLRGFVRDRRPAAPGGGAGWERLIEELEDPESALSRAWDREHDQHVLRRLLELVEREVAPRDWQAFQRYVLLREPVQDIATDLKMTAVAVRVLKSRILSRLRQEAAGLVG